MGPGTTADSVPWKSLRAGDAWEFPGPVPVSQVSKALMVVTGSEEGSSQVQRAGSRAGCAHQPDSQLRA